MEKNRLESFSDGCIAIFITVILLTFQVLAHGTYRDLLPLIPSFVCYLLSFIVIAIYWGNQHHLVHAIQFINSKIMWANLAWLFSLSLVSFATAWTSLNMLAPQTVSFYGVILLLCNRTYVLLEHMVVEQQKFEAQQSGQPCNLEDALGNRDKERLAMCMYVAGAIISLWLPLAALILYMLVNVMWFIPDSRISRHLSRMK
ncbi:TMEM175 family protein [Atopobium fossor]|uniref:TMEM175 family protein n=1 Tax=Atopobium fossor TaxID=39487 RepID=UPI0004028C90|nr:TMEM175 family protein [Atopobium fossor]